MGSELRTPTATGRGHGRRAMAGTAPTWRRDARGERPSRRPAGPARLRRSPVCAGSGQGAAHARLGPEPAEAGAPGGVGCESPGAETQAAGSGPPAQRARLPRGLAPAASRLPEAASPPPEPPPALGAGLLAAERAGTGPEPGSGTRTQVRPAARSRGGGVRPLPAGCASAPPGPRARPGEGGRAAGWPGPAASRLPARPQVPRRRCHSHT